MKQITNKWIAQILVEDRFDATTNEEEWYAANEQQIKKALRNFFAGHNPVKLGGDLGGNVRITDVVEIEADDVTSFADYCAEQRADALQDQYDDLREAQTMEAYGVGR